MGNSCQRTRLLYSQLLQPRIYIRSLQARIDSMAVEMTSLREQLEVFKLRPEKAEAERDADRKILISRDGTPDKAASERR
jgi:hypothetical protein